MSRDADGRSVVDVTLADSPAEFSKYSGWPELKESFMAGKVKAAYLLAPMVMDLVESGVDAKIGPIILGSRQTYRIPFRRPRNFQYACSLHAAGTLTLVIAPAPAAGLDRLRWRLDQLIARS